MSFFKPPVNFSSKITLPFSTIKFVMSLFKAQVSFFSNFAISTSSMLWHFTPLCFFGSNVIYFQQKYPISMQTFRPVTVSIKVCQINYVIFETKSQFSYKLCMTIQFHETQLFCTFSSSNLPTQHDVITTSQQVCEWGRPIWDVFTTTHWYIDKTEPFETS